MCLVVGAPGAGKTTWAVAHAEEGTWVIGREALMDALRVGRRCYSNDARRLSQHLWEAAVVHAARHGLTCHVEHGGATRDERRRMLALFPSDRWHRRIVALVPADPGTCVRRATADPLRPRTTRWGPIVARWYARYEPVTADEADAVRVVTA